MRNALLSQPKNTAWVVATGTLTNVGLLFATFPDVAEHIRGLSIMGGSVGGGFSGVPISKKSGQESRVGNTTPWAEFNIYVSTVLPVFFSFFFLYLFILFFSGKLFININGEYSATQKQHNPSSHPQFLRLKPLSLL